MSDKIFCPVCAVGALRSTYLPQRKAIRRSCINGHMWDEPKVVVPKSTLEELRAAYEAMKPFLMPVGGGSGDVR